MTYERHKLTTLCCIVKAHLHLVELTHIFIALANNGQQWGRTMKRQTYISWDDYFVGIALLSALRSKDPHRKSGACIVNTAKRIVGIGYNGFPHGCNDSVVPWTAEHSVPWLHTKKPYEVPAEINAVLNRCGDTQGSSIYVAQFPCNECAKIIIQSGIREVVYVNSGIEQNGRTSNNGGECIRAAHKLFDLAGVITRQYAAQGRDHIQLLLTVNNKDSDRLCDFEANGDMGECCSENGSKGVSPKQRGMNLDDEKTKRDILILEKEANYKVNLSELVTPKRLSYLSWDDYFMCVAYLSAQRSKDPNTQVGACIVNSMKRIAGVGYNGFPQGCSDDILPWNRSNEGNGEGTETKYLYVCHAEANAILNKGGADIHGSTLYVDLFPCNECAKMIIQTGIKEVVYLRDMYHDDDKCRASRIMFQMSGVTYRQHQLSVKQILLDLRKGESSFI